MQTVTTLPVLQAVSDSTDHYLGLQPIIKGRTNAEYVNSNLRFNPSSNTLTLDANLNLRRGSVSLAALSANGTIAGNLGVAGNLDVAGNLSFNSGYGSSAIAYGCRAWVNFNGTGTVAIRASGNVSSITDQGVGRYKVNLMNAMPDANYVTLGSVLNSTTPAVNGIAWLAGSDDPGATIGSYTTTSFQIGTYYYPTTIFDPQYVQVAIFR